jgi:thioredoxin-dependent peroxiredoxin
MKTGDVVPDFELSDDTGTKRRLSELVADGPVVLFFYPGALTYGCTRESCHFRDLKGEFERVGAHPVGISADSVDKQHQFTEKHSFGFPLLSDPERTVARQFGVARGWGITPVKRSTFVIDRDRTVLGVIHSEVNMNAHADRALAILRKGAATP